MALLTFFFFYAWLKIDDFGILVANSWKQEGISGSASSVFGDKLRRLKHHIEDWTLTHLDSGPDCVKSLKEDMLAWDVRADSVSLSPFSYGQFVEARLKYFKLDAVHDHMLK